MTCQPSCLLARLAVCSFLPAPPGHPPACLSACLHRLANCPPCPHRLQVIDYEKYFVFEHQPGGLEWRILEESCAELAKLAALVDGKIKVCV